MDVEFLLRTKESGAWIAHWNSAKTGCADMPSITLMLCCKPTYSFNIDLHMQKKKKNRKMLYGAHILFITQVKFITKTKKKRKKKKVSIT